MKEYLIWREGDGPDPIREASWSKKFIAEIGPGNALYKYLWLCNGNSHFVDGYPQREVYCLLDIETGEVYCLLDIETGEVYRRKVDAEFQPSFVIGAAK